MYPPIVVLTTKNSFLDSRLNLEPLSRWLVNPLGTVLRYVVSRRSFCLPVRRHTTQLVKVVHHLLMVFLLGLGRLFFVLIVNVTEGVGSLQRFGSGIEGGFSVYVGSTSEPGRRARAGIINWPGNLFDLEIRFGMKLITV